MIDNGSQLAYAVTVAVMQRPINTQVSKTDMLGKDARVPGIGTP